MYIHSIYIPSATPVGTTPGAPGGGVIPRGVYIHTQSLYEQGQKMQEYYCPFNFSYFLNFCLVIHFCFFFTKCIKMHKNVKKYENV